MKTIYPSFQETNSILEKNIVFDHDLKVMKLQMSGFNNCDILINGSDIRIESGIKKDKKPIFEVEIKNFNFKMIDFQMILYQLYYEGPVPLDNFDSIRYTTRYLKEETIYCNRDIYIRN